MKHMLVWQTFELALAKVVTGSKENTMKVKSVTLNARKTRFTINDTLWTSFKVHRYLVADAKCTKSA